MQSQNEKLVQFYDAINRYVERQRLRILYEIEEQSNTELARAEQEGLSDAYRMIQRETDEMRTSINRELAAQEYNGRRALFEQRVDIEKKIFDEAADRLRSFTQTADYSAYLKKTVAAAATVFSAAPDKAVFHLRDEDMKYADELRAAYGAACEFQSDDSIQLGGLLALNEHLGIAIDATLDARLEQQREWFCETADLSVE